MVAFLDVKDVRGQGEVRRVVDGEKVKHDSLRSKFNVDAKKLKTGRWRRMKRRKSRRRGRGGEKGGGRGGEKGGGRGGGEKGGGRGGDYV